MTSSHDADLAALESLSNWLYATLGAIENHQWAMATPCADWRLSELVDHVAGGNWFTSRILAGQSAAGAMAEAKDMFGAASATGERALSSVDDQLRAFRQPGVLDRSHHHVAGDLTGRLVLRLRLHDLIVHTWDIGQTLSPPASIPNELVRWGLEELAASDSQTAKYFGLDQASLPEAAQAIAANYLRRFGRDPAQ